MPAKDFKFISPGVFINEIDNSQLAAAPGDVGPVVIGRAKQGPGLIPTRVNSFQEFVQVFGAPEPGNTSFDVSREDANTGPTYGAYAAQAWLRNNSPITFVRLVGQESINAVADSGEAGWRLETAAGAAVEPSLSSTNTDGGAYGLFVFQSASSGFSLAETTGTLAAIWYATTGSVALSGTVLSGSSNNLGPGFAGAGSTAATNKFIRATGDKEFKVVIKDTLDNIVVDTKFNFTNSSENFIRKVFNTNPTLTNTQITSVDNKAYRKYWLGQTFEDEVNALFTGTGNQVGVMLPLYSVGGTANGGDFRRDFSDPETGFFIAQDLTDNSGSYQAENMEKLFKLRARNTGRWASRNVKVSIADLRASADTTNPYGTFSVLVRAMDDTDNRPKILEQFNNCNLNPASENFVARKIGNKFVQWDDEDRRYREYGDFDNLSDYVYVVLDSSVAEGKVAKESLPFGVYGPPKFLPFTAKNKASDANTMVTGGGDFANKITGEFHERLVFGSGFFDIKFDFPKLRLRVSASEGSPTDPRNVFFGVDTTFNLNGRPSDTVGDYTLTKPKDIPNDDVRSTGAARTEFMYIFTLDDMCTTQVDGSAQLSGTLVYKSGSRQNDTNREGLVYVREATGGDGTYKEILDLGGTGFTTVLAGGFDGLDITEAEPFRNTGLSDKNERNSYAFNSLKVAIDSCRDPENVEFDLAAQPGITNATLNRSLIDMCEDRGDALAIVDLAGGYVPETENKDSVESRLGSVTDTIEQKKQNLQINSSFGAAYYPWVQIQDTINGSIIWAPPSVAALGAMSYGQATQELWFAPAGFTRGGLSANNAAGIPVVGVRERLISKDRDSLYDANINPIAQFPAEGIVIFGQKTLQVTPSALDRINVRRLLIFLKREISRIAATLLFDQNVQSTWNRFRSRVGPLLASVKAGLGLEDYKLVLDETTTTPDLIDRNIMYAQIFLKPARSIEFIAIDFVITDSGASFED